MQCGARAGACQPATGGQRRLAPTGERARRFCNHVAAGAGVCPVSIPIMARIRAAACAASMPAAGGRSVGMGMRMR